jgi:hypothetical protein
MDNTGKELRAGIKILTNEFPYSQVIEFLFESLAWAKPEGLDQWEWFNLLMAVMQQLGFLIETHFEEIKDHINDDGELVGYCPSSLEHISLLFRDAQEERWGRTEAKTTKGSGCKKKK